MENVVIIDSGIGGLSVFNHLVELNCNVHATYLADNLFFPYGTKNDNELINILDRIFTYFINKHYHHIILACNTASVVYSKYLKHKYQVQVYPIIDHTVSQLLTLPRCQCVGVIGTNKTIESGVYQNKIKELLDVKVTQLACPPLVTLCEQYDLNQIKNYIKNHFYRFKQQKIDTMILGCTHFNVIKDEISEYFDHKVQIICSGYSLIESINDKLLNHQSSIDDLNTIYVTKKSLNYQQIIASLFPKLTHLDIKVLEI